MDCDGSWLCACGSLWSVRPERVPSSVCQTCSVLFLRLSFGVWLLCGHVWTVFFCFVSASLSEWSVYSFVCSFSSGCLFILFFVERFVTSFACSHVVMHASSVKCMHTWTTHPMHSRPYGHQTVCSPDCVATDCLHIRLYGQQSARTTDCMPRTCSTFACFRLD